MEKGKTQWFSVVRIQRPGAYVVYFQTAVNFPSWTSRVRVPSPAPFLFNGLATPELF